MTAKKYHIHSNELRSTINRSPSIIELFNFHISFLGRLNHGRPAMKFEGNIKNITGLNIAGGYLARQKAGTIGEYYVELPRQIVSTIQAYSDADVMMMPFNRSNSTK